MDQFRYLNEENVQLFLLQLLVVLGAAKALGEVARRLGFPALAGEILAGIALGPTLLGRCLPRLYQALFPPDQVQQGMLETLSWFGVLFLLLSVGFEVKASSAWRQGRAATAIGVIGVIVPLGLGAGVFYFLPAECRGQAATPVTFALFLGTAAAISALTVIARVLHDLDILKSDLGLLLLSGYVVNDILGWLAFTFVMGLVRRTGMDWLGAWVILLAIAVFAALCLTVGSRAVGAAVGWMKRQHLPQPATTLSFITCLGVLCGAATQSIGIQAILGFFLAGIMAGNAPEISEQERDTISQFIHAVFVPVFFAGIGLRIDFLQSVDLTVLLLFGAVAIGGKFAGAWLGAWVARLSPADCLVTGIAFIPGGAMEIILGMLALELRVISQPVFVAIVCAALGSSVVVGPLMAWVLRRRTQIDTRGLLPRAAVDPQLAALTRDEAIAVLCRRAAAALPGLDPEAIRRAVCEREDLMGTAVGLGVAVPHARVASLQRPLIAFGLSRNGLDWDAPDGQPVHFIFLLLTPADQSSAQLQLLAAIGGAMQNDALRDRLMHAASAGELHTQLVPVLAPRAPRTAA